MTWQNLKKSVVKLKAPRTMVNDDSRVTLTKKSLIYELQLTVGEPLKGLATVPRKLRLSVFCSTLQQKWVYPNEGFQANNGCIQI